MKKASFQFLSVFALSSIAVPALVGCKSPGMNDDLAVSPVQGTVYVGETPVSVGQVSSADGSAPPQIVFSQSQPNPAATPALPSPKFTPEMIARTNPTYTKPAPNVVANSRSNTTPTSTTVTKNAATKSDPRPKAKNVRLVASQSAGTEMEMPQTAIANAAMPARNQPVIRTLQRNENLLEIIESAPGVVLLDFYADWCGPCKVQGNVLHELESLAKQRQARIVKVNIEHHPKIASQLKIETLPTLMVVKNGNVLDSHTGLAQAEQVRKMLAR